MTIISYEHWLKTKHKVTGKNENVDHHKESYINYLFDNKSDAQAFCKEFQIQVGEPNWHDKSEPVFVDAVSGRWRVSTTSKIRQELYAAYQKECKPVLPYDEESCSRILNELQEISDLLETVIKTPAAKLNKATNLRESINSFSELANANTEGWYFSDACNSFALALRAYMVLNIERFSEREIAASEQAINKLFNIKENVHSLKHDANWLEFLHLYKGQAFIDTQVAQDALHHLDGVNNRIYTNAEQRNMFVLTSNSADAKTYKIPRFFPDAQGKSETDEIILQTGGMRKHSTMTRIWKQAVDINGHPVAGNIKPHHYRYYKTEYNAGAGVEWINKLAGVAWVANTKEIKPVYVKRNDGKPPQFDLLNNLPDPRTNLDEYNRRMHDTIENLIIAERMITFYDRPEKSDVAGDQHVIANEKDKASWDTYNNIIKKCLSECIDNLSKPGNPQKSGNCTIMSIKVMLQNLAPDEASGHHLDRIVEELWAEAKLGNYGNNIKAKLEEKQKQVKTHKEAIHNKSGKLINDLFKAIEAGDIKIIQSLINNNNWLLNQCSLSEFKSPPLVTAITMANKYKSAEQRKPYLDIFNWLLEQPDIQLSLVDNNGNTALHKACFYANQPKEGIPGDEAFVQQTRKLIERGADVFVKNKSGEYPLKFKNKTYTKAELEQAVKGADITTLKLICFSTPALITQYPAILADSMRYAALANSNEGATRYQAMVKFLLQVHVNTPTEANNKNNHNIINGAIKAAIKGTDANGNTALHWAHYAGFEQLKNDLVANGASIQSKNKAGETPKEFINIEKFVLDLFEKIERNKITEADKIWLSQNLDKEVNGKSLIHLLLEKMQYKDDKAPLNHAKNNAAISFKYYRVLQDLFHFAPDLATKAVDKKGDTLLHKVLSFKGDNNLDLFCITYFAGQLLERGARLDAVNNAKQTPLDGCQLRLAKTEEPELLMKAINVPSLIEVAILLKNNPDWLNQKFNVNGKELSPLELAEQKAQENTKYKIIVDYIKALNPQPVKINVNATKDLKGLLFDYLRNPNKDNFIELKNQIEKESNKSNIQLDDKLWSICKEQGIEVTSRSDDDMNDTILTAIAKGITEGISSQEDIFSAQSFEFLFLDSILQDINNANLMNEVNIKKQSFNTLTENKSSLPNILKNLRVRLVEKFAPESNPQEQVPKPKPESEQVKQPKSAPQPVPQPQIQECKLFVGEALKNKQNDIDKMIRILRNEIGSIFYINKDRKGYKVDFLCRLRLELPNLTKTNIVERIDNIIKEINDIADKKDTGILAGKLSTRTYEFVEKLLAEAKRSDEMQTLGKTNNPKP